MGRRFGKPTARGYVIFGALAIAIIAIVVGVIIGGGTGSTIDAVGGVLIACLLFILFPSMIPRKRRGSPEDDDEYIPPHRSAGR